VSFQRLGMAAHSARGEHRRHDPVMRGEARVHGLGHGAELPLGATRHTEGEAEGGGNAIRIERQQPRASGGGSEGAQRGGGMPTLLVVNEIHTVADHRKGFDSDSEALEYLLDVSHE